MSSSLRTAVFGLLVAVFFVTAQAADASCVSVTEYLAAGVTHPQVVTLKKFLVNEGLLNDVTYSSYFGPLTEAAVKEWQMRNNIEPTGTVGPKTRAALNQCTASLKSASLPGPLGVQAHASSCEVTTTLSRGMKTEDVTRLQSFLIDNKFLPNDSATGFYGALTEAAVKQFQCTKMQLCAGTPQTTGYGVVGRLTRAALLQNCRSSTVNSQTNIPTTQTTQPLPAPSSNPTPSTAPLPPSPVSVAPTTPTPSVVCTPLPMQTQTVACSVGQTGSVTQTRTSSCPAGAVAPVWSGWSTTTSTCSYPTTFNLKEFWPNPPTGMAYIKEYDAGIASKYFYTPAGFLVKQDYYTNTPGVLIDEWGIRITGSGDVLETYDTFPDKTYYYLPGKEINWGRVLSVGETLGGSVQMDLSRSTGIDATSPSQYGYNSITVVKHHPSLQLQGVTHNNVLEISLFQSFCITNECKTPVTGYYYVSLQYYFAYGKGIIKTIFKDVNGSADAGAHELIRECLVPETANGCGA